MLPLTPNITKAVNKIFPGENRVKVLNWLTERCGNNLPNCESEDEYDMEDLRFAVLKLSEGNIETLDKLIRQVNEDWREVIVDAGSIRKYKRKLIGNELERNPKSDMVSFAGVWNIFTAIITFVLVLFLRLSNVNVILSSFVILSIILIHSGGLLFSLKPFKSSVNEAGKIILMSALTFILFPAILAYIVTEIAFAVGITLYK